MSTPQQHRLIGQVIAERYHVVELLAEGGMGAVYIADHLTLHKQVALKIVHPEHAGNTELTARFEREAMATSRIDHPNVISAIDFGTLPDGTAFLAVQLVRGPSLTKLLTEHGAMVWQRAASFGAQIADALSAAHGHGIIHRDLKPDNVLLQARDDGSELVKVLDFGVAKFAPESKVPLSARTDVTQIGMVVGTPGYMAPEQTIGNPADERSDLYALGVILWESLVGEPLWSAPDLQALVEKQMTETPRLLREAGADASLPDALEQLVASLLARRAEERPNDAGSVREALRDCLADQGSALRWRTGARPVPARVPSSSEVTLPLDPFPRKTPSKTGASKDRRPTPHPFDATVSLLLPDASDVRNTPSQRPRPSVPPPPPPSIRSRRRLRSSLTAWLLTSLLGVVIALAVFLVATGRVQLKPAGDIVDIAQAAERAVQDLNLSEPSSDEPSSKKHTQAAVNTGLPASLSPAFEKLVSADSREERAEGVDTLLAHDPSEVPKYVRHMALLQKGKTCELKLEQVEQLDELSDARSLPVLQRLAARPRVGCGKRKKEDCFACLRKPLSALIKKLEALSP
ncbi:MAG: Serine/threonine protein kinase [Myxococcaceae bacterium]|nr:Serine/threonine protein kinase [Myxococcaceae bacterium]